MRIVQNDKLRLFLTVASNQEALDQPIYHVQTYGTAGGTSFSFFGTTAAAATNGFSDTNLETQNALPKSKKFAIYAFELAMLGGQTTLNQGSTLPTTQLDDVKGAMEGLSNFAFTILDKPYYRVAPVGYIPQGFGTWSGAGGVHSELASAANEDTILAHGNNGVPSVENCRKLRVPIPLPSQVAFNVEVAYPTAVTVGTAMRIAVYLAGIQIRPRQ